MNQRFAGKPRNCSNGGQTTSWIKAEVSKRVFKGTGRSSNVVHLKAISSVAFSLRNVCFHVFVVILKFLIWIGTLRLGPVLHTSVSQMFYIIYYCCWQCVEPTTYYLSSISSTLHTEYSCSEPKCKGYAAYCAFIPHDKHGAVQWCEHSHVVNTRIFSVCVWYDCSSTGRALGSGVISYCFYGLNDFSSINKALNCLWLSNVVLLIKGRGRGIIVTYW